MTNRKPPGISHEEWAERQIREAQERGAFDDLPGAGKPIPDLGRPRTGADWAVAWARREGADLSAILPPMLALRRERERLLESLGDLRSESEVRDVALDFNSRLVEAYRRPSSGPQVVVGRIDPDAAVELWRAARPPAPAAAPEPARTRRRWWRRR